MATNLLPIQSDENEVRVENDVLVLENFREPDARVVAVAKEAENVEALVHDLLAVGGRAMTAAQTTTDVAIVEKAFGEMTSAFTGELDRFSHELDKKTTEMLDDDSGTAAFARAVQEAARKPPGRHVRSRQQAKRDHSVRASDA